MIFTSLHFFTLLDDFHFTSLHFPSLHFTSLHFFTLLDDFHFTSLPLTTLLNGFQHTFFFLQLISIIAFLTLFFRVSDLQGRVPNTSGDITQEPKHKYSPSYRFRSHIVEAVYSFLEHVYYLQQTPNLIIKSCVIFAGVSYCY
jgi:hypothetical protein